MKRFHALLNDGTVIDVAANKMEVTDGIIFAYADDNLTALVEFTSIIEAHLSGK